MDFQLVVLRVEVGQQRGRVVGVTGERVGGQLHTDNGTSPPRVP